MTIRLLRLLVVATLAAGAVGVVRQRAEALQVRRGQLAPPTAAADLPPRRPATPALEALATWVPRRPRRPLSRLAAAVWAAPLTTLGVCLALLAGRRPVWDATHGCLVAREVHSLSGRALRLVGAEANTVGQVVLCRSAAPSASLLAHEAVHVRQGERLGPLLFPLYVWLGARYGYRDHPLERAARLGARRAAGTRRPGAPAGD